MSLGPDLEYPHVAMCKDADRLENIEAGETKDFWHLMLIESEAVEFAAGLDAPAILGGIIKCIAEFRTNNDASELAALNLTRKILAVINTNADKAIEAAAEEKLFDGDE